MRECVSLLSVLQMIAIMHSTTGFRVCAKVAGSIPAKNAFRLHRSAAFASSRNVQRSAAAAKREEPCNVSILNAQRKFRLDKAAIARDANIILQALGVGDQSIEIEFCSEQRIREINRDFRDVDRPTDILSFPTYGFLRPGKIDPKDPFREAKLLGELAVSLVYVEKRCKEDLEYFQTHGAVDEEDDRGVSRAMSAVFDPLKRLPLLLVHGICHLVGYDHENQRDWEQMTAEEERILKLLPGYKKDFDVDS